MYLVQLWRTEGLRLQC